MVHIDRKHPEIGGEANPIRRANNLSNLSNHSKRNTSHDLSRIVPGWSQHMIGNNPYVSGVPNLRSANSSAMRFYNAPIESLLRRYEEDKQKELEVKRRESERASIHESFEDYQTAIKIKETENRKRMEGNYGLDTMNYISSQMAAGRLTPVVTIAREGTISIRYEPTNTENFVKPIAANMNDISGPQLQDMLAILAITHAKSLENIVKTIEVMKRRLDARDEELAHVLAGGVKVSQANNSRAERSRIEEKSEAISWLSSQVEEKNDNRYNGEDEKTSQKETGKVDFADICSSNCEMSSHMTPPLARPLPNDSAWYHSLSPASQKLRKKLEPLG